MRSEKNTESFKYPEMPFSAVCSTLAFPSPQEQGLLWATWGCKFPIPISCKGRRRSVYISERLGFISRRM